ncbi:MAG: ATPase [Sphingomicrobium sp.]
MPQLSQLSLVYASQWFWLVITLAIIYFAIGKGMVPKVERTMDDRNAQIANDLAAADAARTDADGVEEAYRHRMDASRADSAKLTAKAKADSAASTEKKLGEVDQSIDARLAEAQDRIRAARGAAVKDIENLAAELAQNIAAKVARIDVSLADSAKAVKMVISDA